MKTIAKKILNFVFRDIPKDSGGFFLVRLDSLPKEDELNHAAELMLEEALLEGTTKRDINDPIQSASKIAFIYGANWMRIHLLEAALKDSKL